MSGTIGTLNLKIARLERYLHVLKKRELLSSVYPEYRETVAQEAFQVQFELDHLIQYREILLQEGIGPMTGGVFNGDCERRKSFYSVS